MLEFADARLGLEVWIALALAALAMPLVFLGIVAVAVRRRGAAGSLGPRLVAAVAFTGGLTLGLLIPMGGTDLILQGPILATAAVLVFVLWRRRRWLQAGWLLAGLALPWTAVWVYCLVLLAGGAPFEPLSTAAWLALGVAGLVAGALLIRRGDPAPAPPNIAAPPGQPGSRSYGNIAEAIREPFRVGPFGVPELATLVAIIVGWLVVPFLIPAGAPYLIQLVVPVIVVAALGTEVFVRAWPSVSRRAFEAFSWLGEWELARAREITGGGVPSTRAGAARWLNSRPDRPEERPFRIEVALFAGRIDEARSLLAQLPAETPVERFSVAALADLVDWQAGGDGDLAGMEAAAAAIEPVDGDDRLRAEVSIATAQVRRRMAEGRPTAVEVVQPLLDVRERLGRRADGQIGRALRRRLLPVLVLVSAVVVILSELVRAPSFPSP